MQGTMEAFKAQQFTDGQLDRDTTQRDGNHRTLTDVELDWQIRAEWDIWCDLLDDLPILSLDFLLCLLPGSDREQCDGGC
jgi:hypothetical protein